ncbi:thioredoxin family protein [Haloechinothrix sp. LS1_15]|uniref:thioredoxin family protein n=1 Tax=Haloechinothrix sp. LS1_15 TaxID=2652248 RepID=UPI0029483F35|nr:thioredoxin family protein [Haloechinothrix sp. LS1_15]MDV6013592.1 hypothetical protein [Haloechinothrix sp. LS1_15]
MRRAHLQVYIAPGCAGCDTASLLAHRVRRLRPAHRVEIVDVSDPQATVPDAVIGTPAYVLEGAVYSLGNPDLDELLAELDKLAVGYDA